MSVPAKLNNNSLADLLNAHTLDDEMRHLVTRHGAAAVKKAAIRLTKKRKGRPAEKDWQELKDVLQQDAMDWLDGRDPFKERSNYSVAKDFTYKNPGHNHASTQRRIMKKLSAKRHIMFLLHAYMISEESRPFGDYFRTVDAIALVDARWGQSINNATDRNRGLLQRYRERFGEPDSFLSIAEIDQRMKEADKQALASATKFPHTLSGMFGVGRLFGDSGENRSI